MSADFGIRYPLWSYESDPELLDRALGEIGARRLSIPLVTGPVQALRLGARHAPHHFHTDGGWHFAPDPSRYAGSSLRPRSAAWLGRRDPMTRLREQAAARPCRVLGVLDVRAAAACLDVEQHFAHRDAWGESASDAGGCPMNPAVRELLSGAIADLERYALDGVILSAWAPDLPVQRESPRPLAWRASVRALLDICFCAACRQTAMAAGIDASQAARSALVHAAHGWSDQPRVDEAIRNDDLLTAYRRVRVEANRIWWKRLVELHPKLAWYAEIPGDYAAAAQSIPDAVIPLLRPASHGPAPLPEGLRRVGVGELGVAAPVWRPFFADASELVRWVTDAVDRGVRDFDFLGLDEAADEAVGWLRQAVRFARRESEGA